MVVEVRRVGIGESHDHHHDPPGETRLGRHGMKRMKKKTTLMMMTDFNY